MPDKTRQRLRSRLAPQGRMPDWAVVVVAAVVSVLVAFVARQLR